MKCDMCQQEATVFLTQIVNGKMSQINLCEQCSKDKGVTDPQGFELAEVLLGTNSKKIHIAGSETEIEVVCPSCGFSESAFKKVARLGCPDCYQVFTKPIQAMLLNMHKKLQHVGKWPSNTPDADKVLFTAQIPPIDQVEPPKPAEPTLQSIEKRIVDLKRALQRAIEQERYEDAARIRDEIQKLDCIV